MGNCSEPIRVLQVVAKMERNGYESRIMDIYRNLDRNKVQFDFFTHRKEKGDFDDEIIQLGGIIYYNDAISPCHFIRYLRKLNSFFQEHHYDIVHAHLNSYCAWILFAAKNNGVKIRIAHSRNSGFDSGWKNIFKRASKLLVNFPPTHRFACSKEAGIWLFGNRFLTDPDSKVIPNAFNCDAFSFSENERNNVRNELKIKDPELTIANVGRLTPQKNHEKVFSIFKKLLEYYPDAKLFLFGSGELYTELTNKIEKMGIKEHVVFMGNRPDIYRYLNGMDIMLFPSRYEGFGTVAIEAQANGLPVVASDALPKETKLTDIIQYLSINDSDEIWVQQIIQFTKYGSRFSRTETIKEAGYDMKANALNMQNFYINSLA